MCHVPNSRMSHPLNGRGTGTSGQLRRLVVDGAGRRGVSRLRLMTQSAGIAHATRKPPTQFGACCSLQRCSHRHRHAVAARCTCGAGVRSTRAFGGPRPLIYVMRHPPSRVRDGCGLQIGPGGPRTGVCDRRTAERDLERQAARDLVMGRSAVARPGGRDRPVAPATRFQLHP